jgi:glycosyltransferase involved in cell wall biosynthesis
MIRVCFMVDAPFLGGAERYVSRLALGLDRARFLPSLILREPDVDDGGLAEWAGELEAAGIRVSRVPMNLPFRPWHARGILDGLRRHQPDVVHVNMPGPYSGQTGLLVPLARMAGARAVITTEHLPMIAPLWKRAPVRRWSYRYVDTVLTVCRANVSSLTRVHHVPAERVVVIPNGIRDDFGQRARPRGDVRRKWGIGANEVVVLFLGNLLRHKGLHRVIGALCEMPAAAWHLVVAGRGPEEARARARLEEAGLSSRATFLGAVAAGEVESVISASDLLALPSTVEGMPYVIIEAMACSVPVVAGDVYGIPELITDGVHGRLVAPKDEEAVRGALAELIADGGIRARMGAAARRRFLEQFTLSQQVAAVTAEYLRVLGVRA